jgi:hypothetical protein
MPSRSQQQKTGARGHRWLMALIEENPGWLARGLDEDYGIDIEAELTEGGLHGEILKIQIKSTARAERRDGQVAIPVEKRYVEYADTCRYPVILAFVATETKEAWYLWLQDWLRRMRGTDGRLDPNQSSWTCWVPEHQTVAAGLSGELKSIARWKGDTQLILSLMDALRSAAATYDRSTVDVLTSIISAKAPTVADASLNALIDQAINLGDRMRGTPEGNEVADQLFALVRRHGARVSQPTVHDLVIRGDSYSRAGVTALGILYDEFFEHMASLDLPNYFLKLEPRVAFYCAFREAFPAEKATNLFVDPTGFIFAGLEFKQPDMFYDKYANRGASALLDYLIPATKI